MYIHKPPPKTSSPSFGDILIFLIFGVFPATCLIIMLYRHIRNYYRSFQFHQITRLPRHPSWLNINSFQFNNQNPPNECIRIHRKTYQKEMWMGTKGKEKEKNKLVMIMMRKMLEEILCIPIGERLLPDTSCVISIPKKNFKSASTPGEFTLKHRSGLFTDFFEYQMIGDDRIQVVYYVADGIRYVAGLCIYIQNPYQSIIHYRESIVKKLLNEPEYWPSYNLQSESIGIIKRTTVNKEVLVTRNRYGDTNQWILNGDSKKFKSLGPYLEVFSEDDEGKCAQILSKNCIVKVCQTQKNMVMISIRNGQKMHSEYCKKNKMIRYFKCETCNAPDDIDPPSYSSLQGNS